MNFIIKFILDIETRIEDFLNFLQDYINLYTKFYFFTPHDRTIGNTAEEIHFSLIFARKMNKKIVLLRRFSFFQTPKICNKEIFLLNSPYIYAGPASRLITFILTGFLTLLLGHIPAFLYYFFRNIQLLAGYAKNRFRGEESAFPYAHLRGCFHHLTIGLERVWSHQNFSTVPFSKKIMQQIDWKKEVGEPVSVDLSQEKKIKCAQVLERMGLRESDWFVCLHNREPGYHGDKTDRRNSKIESYFKAIEHITSSGGWVIRMGDRSMTKLPPMNRVIDYPFTSFKSEAMDLFLMKNCRFFLGQNSGIVDVAYLFHKQCALVNVTEWAIGFPRLQNSRAIFKHIFSKEHNKFLSLEELLSLPFESQDLHKISSNYDFIDNSADEILSLAKEVMFITEKTAMNELQLKFQESRSKQIDAWLSLDSLHPDPRQNRIFKFRLATRCFSLSGTAGRDFLEKNWNKHSLN